MNDTEAVCPDCGCTCTAQKATASTPSIAYCWQCGKEFYPAPATAQDPIESPWVCVIDKATKEQIAKAADAFAEIGIHGKFTCGTVYGAAYKHKKGLI